MGPKAPEGLTAINTAVLKDELASMAAYILVATKSPKRRFVRTWLGAAPIGVVDYKRDFP
jgi:hypothetical protein